MLTVFVPLKTPITRRMFVFPHGATVTWNISDTRIERAAVGGQRAWCSELMKPDSSNGVDGVFDLKRIFRKDLRNPRAVA